jgi:hypothetical protein
MAIHARQQNLQALVTAIILDGNSQVCFYKTMLAEGVIKISGVRCHARSAT